MERVKMTQTTLRAPKMSRPVWVRREYGEVGGVVGGGEVEDQEVRCHHEDVAVFAVALSECMATAV